MNSNTYVIFFVLFIFGILVFAFNTISWFMDGKLSDAIIALSGAGIVLLSYTRITNTEGE